EVLNTLGDFYPRFKLDTEDREALTEVRRAFHTLKGSGRLVGATSIGELAWSVENLLNRVLDRSLPANDQLFDVIDRTLKRLPELLDAFRAGNMQPDVAGLISEAEAIAASRKPVSESTTDEQQVESQADVAAAAAVANEAGFEQDIPVVQPAAEFPEV